jgi:uncharacterized protein (TIRG00374 family)
MALQRNTAPPSRRRLEIVVLGSAALFVGAMAVAAAFSGFAEVMDRLSLVSLPLLLLLLALSLVNYVSRSIRWHILSKRLGLDVRFGDTVLYYVAGFAMTTTPGKIGEAVRLWLLHRGEGCSYARTAPLAIGDRVGDLLAMLVTCAIGLTAVSGHAIEVAAMAAFCAVLCAALAIPRIPIAVLTLGYRWTGRAPRLFAGLRRVARLSAGLVRDRTALLALLLGIVGWLAECLALYLLLAGMGVEIPVNRAIFVFSFSMLVGGFSMLPGGLGGTEVTMVALLVASGVELHTAIAATAIIRITTLWFAVALGLPALAAAMRTVAARSAPDGGRSARLAAA